MNKLHNLYIQCICIVLFTSVLPIQAVLPDTTGSLSLQDEAAIDPSAESDSAIWDNDEDEDNPWLPVKDLFVDLPQNSTNTAAPADSSQINEPAEVISLPDTAITFSAIDSVDTNAYIVRILDSLCKTLTYTKHYADTMYTDMQSHFDEIQSCIERLDKKQLKESDSLYAEFTALKKNYRKMYKRLARFQDYHRDRWAIGYEEGPAFRWRFKSDSKPQKRNRGLSVGIGYQLNQLKDNYHRALHEGHLRVGIYQEFAVFSRVRIAAYFDAMERMKQMEAEPLMFETTFNRYALWITKLRAGVQINLFSLKHFLLTYRFGFEFSYSTPPYIVNSSKTTFTKYGKGMLRYGISGSDLSALEMIINNIGIYIYF